MSVAAPAAVIAFWRAAGPGRWFERDNVFDDEVRRRFLATYEAAAAGKLTDWEQSAEGSLALLILLDQFPRNMFRGEARAFATDALARAVASRAILNGFDGAFPDMRGFFYLPFEHSENLADQERCIALYKAAGDADGVKWAEIHADIIRRFGRFPHRNAVLGRMTTPEEQKFLDDGGFSG
ncbi:MAG TPA: DUF924 family protein [Pseudolabrys sp.]|nr:DUF924 family protein [Pseudolabrys sp.]